MYSSPSPQESSKLLTKTSLLFVISGAYAYHLELYYYSLLLLLNTVLSVNYWRKPVYGTRRNLDKFFAKVSFVIFLTSGVYYVRTWLMIPGTLLLFQIIYYYMVGQHLADVKKYKLWYYYHAMFHFYALLNQLVILYSIN